MHVQNFLKEWKKTGSMQYLFKAWPTIIELASVYKRLREFESKIKKDKIIDSEI